MTALTKMRGAALLQLAALGLMGAFETVHMQDHGLSEARIGVILAIQNGLMMVTALLWGRWADHTRQFKRCLSICTVGMMATLAWFAWADDFGDFLIYGLMRGLFFTGVVGLMPALALANLDARRPGSGFGGYRRFGSLGFLWAASVMPLLFEDISHMATVAVFYLPLSLWFVAGLSDPKAPRGVELESRAWSANPAFWLFLTAHFLVSMSEPGVHGFFNTYARELGASMEWVGILSGMTGVVALLTLGYMGRLADRIGAAKMLIIGFVAQGLRMLTTSYISDADWLWVAHMFHGFGWAGREVGTLLFLASLLGKQRLGMAASVMMSGRMGGMMVGSLVMGSVAESQGYPVMFQVIAGCVGLGLIMLGLALLASRRATVKPSG
jgi:MFS family permease